MAFDVDAASSCTASELGVLARGERDMGFAVPLVELFKHDGPGGHVDAERQGFCGEDGLDQSGGEQFLDDFLEGGQHAGVVRGDATLEGQDPVVVPEDREVLVGDVGGSAGRDVFDDPCLVGRGEAQAGAQALLNGGVAACPAEDERDRGQQACRVEPVDDLGPVRRRVALRPVAATSWPAGGLPDGLAVCQPDEVRVDLAVAVVGEQVVQPSARQHVLPQRDRTVLVDDDLGAAAHLGEPVAELLGVADRRGQRDDADALRKVDDHLFPNGAPLPVSEVMHLVEDHVAQVLQCGRARVEHVPQDLGGHHDDGRVAVDGVVAGEQPNGVAVVAPYEVVVLLVGQRLDRRGVEALLVRLQREVDRVLADDGLA